MTGALGIQKRWRGRRAAGHQTEEEPLRKEFFARRVRVVMTLAAAFVTSQHLKGILHEWQGRSQLRLRHGRCMGGGGQARNEEACWGACEAACLPGLYFPCCIPLFVNTWHSTEMRVSTKPWLAGQGRRRRKTAQRGRPRAILLLFWYLVPCGQRL